MAISRSLMNRQLQANGGIMQVAPREKFGLGSSIKSFARKIIPNEVAEIAVKAAPFVAPFNPAVAAAMSGIGTFDQTGSIGDSLKGGALTYGLGQGARYIGGAGFQTNPFASGGAFTPSGFTQGFSSPIGTQTGLGKLFSNRGTKGVQGVGVDSGRGGDSASALARSSANAPGAEVLASEVSYQAPVVTGSGNNPFGYKDAVTESISTITDPSSAASKARAMGDTILKTTVDKSVVAKEPGFLKNMFDGVANQDYGKVAQTIGDGVKKFGKAMFTDKDGNIDKAVVLGAIAFTGSYAEARALAAETGVDEDLTEAEYDELTKADKQEEYAGYLTNFFGGQKDGGRIGLKFGSEPKDAEVGIMTIDVEAGDDEDEEENDLMAGITFSSAEKSYLFRRLGATGGSSRSSSMPNLYRILSNPSSYPNDAAILKQIAIQGLNKKDGGRIGFNKGTGIFSVNEAVAENMQIGKLPYETTSMILELNRNGKTVEEISEMTGIDIADVGEMLKIVNMKSPINVGDDFDALNKMLAENIEIRERPSNLSYKAQGGRIGYKEGKGLEEILATDTTISNNPNDPRNMTTEEIIAVINSGRSTPEMFQELMLRNSGGVNEIDMGEGEAFSFANADNEFVRDTHQAVRDFNNWVPKEDAVRIKMFIEGMDEKACALENNRTRLGEGLSYNNPPK